jgi:hypothetical protein
LEQRVIEPSQETTEGTSTEKQPTNDETTTAVSKQQMPAFNQVNHIYSYFAIAPMDYAIKLPLGEWVFMIIPKYQQNIKLMKKQIIIKKYML